METLIGLALFAFGFEWFVGFIVSLFPKKPLDQKRKRA